MELYQLYKQNSYAYYRGIVIQHEHKLIFYFEKIILCQIIMCQYVLQLEMLIVIIIIIVQIVHETCLMKLTVRQCQLLYSYNVCHSVNIMIQMLLCIKWLIVIPINCGTIVIILLRCADCCGGTWLSLYQPRFRFMYMITVALGINLNVYWSQDQDWKLKYKTFYNV